MRIHDLLNEFFGPPIEVGRKLTHKDADQNDSNNDLYWYILDHDRLHKDYFLPLAQKIKKESKSGKLNKEKFIKELQPMVDKGCLEYYQHKKLTGKLGKLFPKELREELCEKLYDHYYEDIIKDCYSLGI